VNEHLTSQCCPACEGHLDDDRTVGEGDRVGRYKRCESVHCRGRVWERDLVGATNILKAFVHLVLYGERPRCLRSRLDVDGSAGEAACMRSARVCQEEFGRLFKTLKRASDRVLRAIRFGDEGEEGEWEGEGEWDEDEDEGREACMTASSSSKRYKNAEPNNLRLSGSRA
jgi:hypothetical protein